MATQAIDLEASEFRPVSASNQLLDDVLRGMVFSREKSIPSYHLYSERGMELYHKLSDHPSYYPIAAEEELLGDTSVMANLLRPLNGSTAQYVASLGPGAGHKDLLLLNHLAKRMKVQCTYNPIDVCAGACVAAGEMIQNFFRERDVPVHLDYRANGLEFLTGLQASRGMTMPRLIAYFGSTFGNFGPPHNLEHLLGIAQQMVMEDHLLIGLDMNNRRKRLTKIEEAYNNPPTVAWVMYLLEHINAKLGTQLRGQDFDYYALFDGQMSAIRTILVAKRKVESRIPGTSHTIRFRAGEELLVEVSMKYTATLFKELLAAAGLQVVTTVENHHHYYNLYLLRKVRRPQA